MKKLNIYLSAQAVMYLPIYVAKEKGLFSTLLQDTEISLIPADGDYDAIKRMNTDNISNNKELFAIAISDPNAIRGLDDIRVIGALIDKVSFWAISKKDIACQDKTGCISNNDFKKVIHYNENLLTGYRLGSNVKEKAKIQENKIVNKLGEEFENFQNVNDTDIIISPDLLKIAQLCVKKEAYINYHFAKDSKYMDKKYITTAILTSQWCINNKDLSKKLVLVIEAIQKAKAIIYSSKQIAREILMKLNCMSTIITQQKKAVADKIIDIIRKDNIYPFDMNISEEQWNATDSYSNIDFNKYIINDIVTKSEQIIATQFGITIYDTFKDKIETEIKSPLNTQINTLKETIENQKETIESQKETIESQKETIERLKKLSFQRFRAACKSKWIKYKKAIRIICVAVFILYVVIWGIAFFFYNYYSEKLNILATGLVIPIIIFFLSIRTKQKKNNT